MRLPVCGAGHAVRAAAKERLCLVKHQDGVHRARLLLRAPIAMSLHFRTSHNSTSHIIHNHFGFGLVHYNARQPDATPLL